MPGGSLEAPFAYAHGERSGACPRTSVLVREAVERLLKAVGVRALCLGERFEPVSDLREAFLARDLRHARIHVGVFVRLPRNGCLEVRARISEREIRRGVAA